MKARPWVLLIEWLAMLGLYLLFVGQVSGWELFAGVFIAAAAVVAWRITWGNGLREAFGDWGAIALGRYLVVYAFTGTWEVLVVLARRIFRGRPADSLFRVVPFETGGDDPRSEARRALAVAYTSMTPNFIVLDIDREKRVMLYHQIQRGEVLEMTKRLGARP